MCSTKDPTDHFRTTCPHTGEYFIDRYCWPGVSSIVLGVLSLASGVAAAAYRHYEFLLTCGVVAVLAIAGGLAWLVVEHHRVIRIERDWLAAHSVTTAESPLRAVA
ncbi:protein UsfY [Mycobacterium sp. TY814]|uniref:protein UsfY n=1 Tax=unclassified Mycobacterium TaxID=2642494 RepID=UPI002741F86E|nr:protein UsfY [Mycobacterium sp. TY814]MDP7723155.1 protein UsfY [Mycobacterium sp. TY814]